MKISSVEEYGLRCLLQLARAEGQSLGIHEIARAERLSEAYVGKLLYLLRKAGLVISSRGARGGYVLAQTPRRISMAGVMQALASTPSKKEEICERFPGEGASCVHLHGACSLRTVWFKIYRHVWKVLASTTLADLLKEQDQNDMMAGSRENKNGFT